MAAGEHHRSSSLSSTRAALGVVAVGGKAAGAAKTGGLWLILCAGISR